MRPSHFFYYRAAALLSLGVPENSLEGLALKQFLLAYTFYYSPPSSSYWPQSPLSKGMRYYQDDGFKSDLMQMVFRLYGEQYGINANYFTPCLVSDSNVFYDTIKKKYTNANQTIVEVNTVKAVSDVIVRKIMGIGNNRDSLVLINHEANTDGSEYFELINAFHSIRTTLALNDINIVFFLRLKDMFFVITPPDDRAEELSWRRSVVLEGIYNYIGNHGMMRGMHEIIRYLAEKVESVKTILSQFSIKTPEIPIVKEVQKIKTVEALIESSWYQQLQRDLQTFNSRFTRWFLSFIEQIGNGLVAEVDVEKQTPNMKKILHQSLNVMTEMMQKVSFSLRANAVNEAIVYAYLLLEELKLWVDLIEMPTAHPLLGQIAIGPKDQNELFFTGSGLGAFDAALRIVEQNFKAKREMRLDPFEQKPNDEAKLNVLVVNGMSTYFKLNEIIETMNWNKQEIAAINLKQLNHSDARYDAVIINVFPAHFGFKQSDKNDPEKKVMYALEQRYLDPTHVVEILFQSGKLADKAVILIDSTMSPYAHPESIKKLLPWLEKQGLSLILFASLTKLGFCGMDTVHGGMVQVVDPSGRLKRLNTSNSNDDLSKKMLYFLARHCFQSLTGYIKLFSESVQTLSLKYPSGMKPIPKKIPYSYLIIPFNNLISLRLIPLLASLGLHLNPRDAYGYPTASYCYIEGDVRLSPGALEINQLEIMVLILIELSRQKAKDYLFQKNKNDYFFPPLISQGVKYLMERYYDQTKYRIDSKAADDEVELFGQTRQKNQRYLNFLSKFSLFAIIGPDSDKTKNLLESPAEFEGFQRMMWLHLFWESLVLLMAVCNEKTFFNSVFGNKKLNHEIKFRLNDNIYRGDTIIIEILALFSQESKTLLDYGQQLEKPWLVMWLCAMDKTFHQNNFEESDDSETESDSKREDSYDDSPKPISPIAIHF